MRAHATIERIAAERGTQIGEQRVGLQQNFDLRTCEEQRAHASWVEISEERIDPQGARCGLLDLDSLTVDRR